jgi:hypothetical protein
MLKILSMTLIVVFFLYSVVYIFGYVAQEEYSGSITEHMDESPDVIWKIINDIPLYKFRKKDVENIEVTEKFRGLTAWREFYSPDEFRLMRTVERRDNQLLKVEILENPRGLTGTWTYILQQDSTGTNVTVKEESVNTDTFRRGLDQLRGRDIHIKNELKWIRVAIFQLLLTTR